MDAEAFRNLIRREVALYMASRATSRPGIVKSYDPATHSAKVAYQPEDTLSGWIPVGSHGVGSGFGVAFAPNIGDQVMVHFFEGEQETGVIGLRLFSTQDVPPNIPAGGMCATDSTGSGIIFPNDGSGTVKTTGTITVTVGGDAEINIAGDANVSIAGAGTITAATLDLGGPGGPAVARVGDPVTGGTISAGSSTVFAVD